jgi:hypothetical protein
VVPVIALAARPARAAGVGAAAAGACGGELLAPAGRVAGVDLVEIASRAHIRIAAPAARGDGELLALGERVASVDLVEVATPRTVPAARRPWRPDRRVAMHRTRGYCGALP